MENNQNWKGVFFFLNENPSPVMNNFVSRVRMNVFFPFSFVQFRSVSFFFIENKQSCYKSRKRADPHTHSISKAERCEEIVRDALGKSKV